MSQDSKEDSLLLQFCIGPDDAPGEGSVGSPTSGHELGRDLALDQTNNNTDSSSLQQSPLQGDILPMRKSRVKRAWYHAFSMTYKRRLEDFKRLFPDAPENESLIVDYSCALQKEILVHGRMYISNCRLCFHANIMRWEAARISFPYKKIIAITKEKTAIVIPNAIEVKTKSGDRFFFASFGSRDKSYLMLFRIWQNCLLDQLMPPSEIMNWIKQCYGDDLGDNSVDEDNVSKGSSVKEFEPLVGSPDDVVDMDRTVVSIKQRDYHVADSSSDDALHMDDDAAAGDLMESDEDLLSSSSLSMSIGKGDDEPFAAMNGTVNGDSAKKAGDRASLCGCTDHPRRMLLENTYNLTLDYMYDCLFSDNEFSRDYRESRKVHVEDVTEWSALDDDPDRCKRILTYSVVSNLKVLGSTVITSKEIQICKRTKTKIVVDTEINNSNVPYSDKFYIQTRYCLVTVSDSKTWLSISSEIGYRKSIWGLTKSIIEKNSIEALRETFSYLDQRLCTECRKAFISCPVDHVVRSPRLKASQRRRRSAEKIRRSVQPDLDAAKTLWKYVSVTIIMVGVALVIDFFLYMRINNINERSNMICTDAMRSVHCDLRGWEQIADRLEVLMTSDKAEYRNLLENVLGIMNQLTKQISDSSRQNTTL